MKSSIQNTLGKREGVQMLVEWILIVLSTMQISNFVLTDTHKQVATSEDVMEESPRVSSKTEDVWRPTTGKQWQHRMVTTTQRLVDEYRGGTRGRVTITGGSLTPLAILHTVKMSLFLFL